MLFELLVDLDWVSGFALVIIGGAITADPRGAGVFVAAMGLLVLLHELLS